MYKKILLLLLVLSLLAVSYTQPIAAKTKKKEGCYGKFPKPQGIIKWQKMKLYGLTTRQREFPAPHLD